MDPVAVVREDALSMNLVPDEFRPRILAITSALHPVALDVRERIMSTEGVDGITSAAAHSGSCRPRSGVDHTGMRIAVLGEGRQTPAVVGRGSLCWFDWAERSPHDAPQREGNPCATWTISVDALQDHTRTVSPGAA